MNIFMRLTIISSMVLTILFASSSSPAFAQLQDAYTSGIQIANLESLPANITVIAYDKNGDEQGRIDDEVPANDSVNYFQHENIPNGFSGAIVISSNKQTAALSNIVTTDFALGASYVGRDGGSTTILLPLLQYEVGQYFSWFSIQNAGSDPANIKINYSTHDTLIEAVIPKGAALVFPQQEEADLHADDIAIPGQGVSFSAEITSDQPIVAAVVIEDPTTIFAYTGFNKDLEATETPAFPLINSNNNGTVTGVQIQNAGTEATEVTLSYTPSVFGTAVLGAPCTETQTIEPGQSNTFAYFSMFEDFGLDIFESNCAQSELFVGSAVVTTNSANQPLVGIANQLAYSPPGNFAKTVQAEAYGSFSPDNATNKVVMPLIMDRNGGILYTGFNMVNVGTTDTTLNCEFSGTSYAVTNQPLEANAAFTALQLNEIPATDLNDAGAYVGSGTCTAGDGAKIVGVVNQLGNGSATDVFYVYEGINVE